MTIHTLDPRLYDEAEARDLASEQHAEARARFSPYGAGGCDYPPVALCNTDEWQRLNGHVIDAVIAAGEWKEAVRKLLDAKDALEAAVVRLKTEEARVAATAIGPCVGLVVEQKRIADKRLVAAREALWELEWEHKKGEVK